MSTPTRHRTAAAALLAITATLAACSTAISGDPVAATTLPASSSAPGTSSGSTATTPDTSSPVRPVTPTVPTPSTNTRAPSDTAPPSTPTESSPPATTTTPTTAEATGGQSPMLVTGDTISRPAVPSGPGVTIPLRTLPTTYDPNSYQSPGFVSEVAALTLPSAYLVDPYDRVALDTDVVADVDVHTEPLKIVYHLNPKATWSDGEPVSCQDFYLAWLANSTTLTDPKDKAKPAFGVYANYEYSQAKAPKCSDGGQTVTVTFRAPTASWPMLFQGMLPAHIAADDAGVSDVTTISNKATSGPILKLAEAYSEDFSTFAARTSVSAGPYLLKSADTSDIVLERNPTWWGNPAGPEEVHLMAAPDDAVAIQALQNGEADAISLTTQDPATASRADGISGVTRSNQLWPISEHLEFNLTKKLFDGAAGKALRQAVFRCVDRSTILDSVARPLNPDASLLGNLFVGPWDPAYTDHYSDYRSADPAAAKKIMQQAGWKLNKDGVFAHGSTTATFTIKFLENPSRHQTATIMQQECGKVGIEIKTTTMQYSDQFDGKYQAALFAWSAPVIPADYSYTYASDGSSNSSGYSNPKVDRLLKGLGADPTPGDESETLNQIDKIMAGDYFSLPLYDWSVINLQQDDIRTTVTNNYTWGGPVWDVYAWTVTD